MTMTSLGVMGQFHRCYAMEKPYISAYDERIHKYVTPYTVRCKECGWIGHPKIKKYYPKKLRLCCRGCGRVNSINKKLFVPLNNIHLNNRKFGICPNSTPKHIHTGRISDEKIKSLRRKQLIEISKLEGYKFYCYECNQHFNIKPCDIKK